MKRVVQSHRTKRGGMNLTLKILFFSLACSSLVLNGWSPDQHRQHWLGIYEFLGPTPDLLEALERGPGCLSLNSFSRWFWCTLTFENNCSSLWASQVELVGKKLLASAGDVRDEGSTPGQEDTLVKGTATHSSILAWRISWTKEPFGLQSIESQRVRHDWSNLACKRTLVCSLLTLHTCISQTHALLWMSYYQHRIVKKEERCIVVFIF